MRYLVFDIECANCFRGNGKICSFGFVIADENFNILARDDIIINPLSPFHLNAHRADKEVKLAYPEEYFYAAAPFVEHYSRIKQLLEYPDQIVIGHAISNDVNYLNSETKRFGLPSFDFKYFDSHLLYADYCGDGHARALDKIAEQFGIVFLPHRSDEDSYATLEYVKAICDSFGMSLPQAIEKAHIHFGTISNYCITPTYSDDDEQRKKAMASSDKVRSRRIDLDRFIERKELTPASSGAFVGKTISFGDEFFLRELCVIRHIVQLVYEKGGSCVGEIEKSDVCVASDDRAEAFAGRFDMPVMLESEFFETLGTTLEAIRNKLMPPKRLHFRKKNDRGYRRRRGARVKSKNNKKSIDNDPKGV